MSAKDQEANDLENTGEMPAGLDVYKPKERFIFKYFDGEKMKVADPLVLHRRFQDKVDELDADMKAANFPGYEGADKAFEGLQKNLRKIFQIKPLEEGGLTPTELEELLGQFLDYCDWAKKKWNLIPISPTETSASTASSSEENPPIQNSSASTSTATVPPTSGPTSLPSVQVSPSVESTQVWRIGAIPAQENP